MVFVKLLFVLLLLVPITLFVAYLFYKSAQEFAKSRNTGGGTQKEDVKKSRSRKKRSKGRL